MTTDRLETLLDRLIDFDATASDLDELVQLIRVDDECARRLGHALEAERLLRTGMRAAERRAAIVQMNEPEHVTAATHPPRQLPRQLRHPQHRRNLAFAASWTLTAASLAFATIVATRMQSPSPQTTGLATGAPTNASVQTPVTRADRQILGALPPVAVGMRQGADGHVDVLFIRTQIERANVADIYRLAKDEHGRPVPIRTKIFAAAHRRSM